MDASATIREALANHFSANDMQKLLGLLARIAGNMDAAEFPLHDESAPRRPSM